MNKSKEASAKVENQTARYFKYAIGEIILVVIGILIALQINNWNENRKLKIQERAYYCQLIDDITADISNLDLSIHSLNDRQRAAKQLLTNLLKIQENKELILKDYLPAVRSKSFIPTKAAIEDITSSGKLENIRNQAHKKAILNYYVEQDVALKIIEGNDEQITQKIFSYNDYTEFGVNELPLYRDLYGEELQNLLVSIEWQKDPNDHLFKNLTDHMNMTVIICEREKVLLAGIKSKAKEIHDLIEPVCR